jgi:integrase
VPRNVADLANPPKAKRARSRNARDKCWSRDQLVTFLDHSREVSDRLYPLWFLIATTGLRRAETLALRWTDVDLDAARLTIRETVTVADGVVVWQDDAKSDDSERTIALDARTVAVLHDHRRQQLERRLACGPAWSTAERDRDLMFTRHDGTAIPPKRASQMFTRRVDAAGLPRIGVHGLRHTWATLARYQFPRRRPREGRQRTHRPRRPRRHHAGLRPRPRRRRRHRRRDHRRGHLRRLTTLNGTAWCHDGVTGTENAPDAGRGRSTIPQNLGR